MNRKEIEKKNEKEAYLAKVAQLTPSPAWPSPSPPPSLVVYLRQASTQLCVSHAEAADDGEATQLPPWSPPRAQRLPETSRIHSPSPVPAPIPLSPDRRRQRRPPEHRHAHAQP